MVLEVQKTEKVSKNYRLTPDSVAVIAELAELYGTNVSNVLEAMVQRFGPKILEQERKQRGEQS